MGQSLFSQAKDLNGPLGPRLSGEPEILHEVQLYIGYGMSRAQIQRILEYVPEVFPENWESPGSYQSLNDIEKKAYIDIAKVGPFTIPGPIIQGVIEIAVEYRRLYGNSLENNSLEGKI